MEKKLEWYAFRYDINTRSLERINVLYEDEIRKWIKRDKVTGYESFKKCIKSILMSRYWCRSEYEVMVADLFVKEPDDYFKIDIWYQLEPNLDRICEYIIRELKLKY